MKNNFRTDLANEARDLWQKSAGTDLPGLFTRREDREGFAADTVEILSDQASEVLCKPKGRYFTMDLGPLVRREEDAFPRACRALAGELRRQLALRPGESVLVVCLGNPDITPDAVGPLTAGHVLVTRHLRERLPELAQSLRPVSVFRAGVLGTTGVESARLTAAVTREVGPDRVIAVDALAAREAGRLCRAVQIADAGIVPGSGVGNAREELSRRTLGVPVIAVGVPTVVDARTLCADLTGREAESLPPMDLFVTPRDVDCRVRETARLLGRAIDLAVQEALTPEDLDALLA